MSIHYITINISNIEHYISYINDKLYGICNVTRGDTILVNDKYIFGFDGKRFVYSSDDYINIPVGIDLPIDIFNKHQLGLDYILLDIDDSVKHEMLSNLTPFSTKYRGNTIYFMTTNPTMTYKKMKNIIETSNTLLLGYEDNNLLYFDIEQKFHLDDDYVIISNNESKCEAIISWNNLIFHIRYSCIMHLVL